MAVLINVLVLCVSLSGSVTADPCVTYQNLTADSTRSPSHLEPVFENKNCDITLSKKWYRLSGDAGTDLTNDSSVLVTDGCGTLNQLWMNGDIPDVSDEIVDREICLRSPFSNCHSSFTVQVKNCCSFRVYNLKSSNNCPAAYCVSPSLVPPTGCSIQTNELSTTTSSKSETTVPGNIESSASVTPETTSASTTPHTTSASTTPHTTRASTTTDRTTTGISINGTFTTMQTKTSSDEVTTPVTERSSNTTIIVLAVVCVVLLVLFIGLSFALYMRCKTEKNPLDSIHFGNAAMRYCKDTRHAFSENTFNSRHEQQIRSNSQTDGDYQDINDIHTISDNPNQDNSLEGPYYELNPSTDMHVISDNRNQDNSLEGPYYALNRSTVQSQDSPYEDLKSPSSSNPYDILSEYADVSNNASNLPLKKEGANNYTKIQKRTE